MIRHTNFHTGCVVRRVHREIAGQITNSVIQRSQNGEPVFFYLFIVRCHDVAVDCAHCLIAAAEDIGGFIHIKVCHIFAYLTDAKNCDIDGARQNVVDFVGFGAQLCGWIYRDVDVAVGLIADFLCNLIQADIKRMIRCIDVCQLQFVYRVIRFSGTGRSGGSRTLRRCCSTAGNKSQAHCKGQSECEKAFHNFPPFK